MIGRAKSKEGPVAIEFRHPAESTDSRIGQEYQHSNSSYLPNTEWPTTKHLYKYRSKRTFHDRKIMCKGRMINKLRIADINVLQTSLQVSVEM